MRRNKEEKILHQKFLLDQNNKIKELYHNGNTTSEIIKLVNISAKTLRNRLRSFGLPLDEINKRGYNNGVKERKEVFKIKNRPRNDKILNLYNNNKTIVEISKMMKMPRCSIGKILTELGIPKEERRKKGLINGMITQNKKLKNKQNEENKKIKELYDKGFLIKDISKEVGLDINALTRRLNKLGTNKIDRIRRGTRAGIVKRMRNDIDIEEVKDLYLNKKLSTVQIAKKMNCSSRLITETLEKMGVERRDLEEACKLHPTMHMLGKKLSELERKKMSAGMQGVSLEDWKGFISFEPYTEEFNRHLKKQIRKRDNQICMNCGIHREKLRRALNIHHINYDKKCNLGPNLISLCDTCHALTNFNREYWTKLFQYKLSILYNYKYDEKANIILELSEVKNEN